MTTARQYAVLGPLQSGAETRAFLGCEVIDGAPHPDLPVVVVWLPEHVTKDPKLVARVQRETAFVTQFKHPNIIRVYGLECFEEGWARVVAFVDGEPLHRILAKARQTGQRLDPAFAARIVIDTCEGVHHAHEEGQSRYAGRPIVHGGIRPDTLLVTFQGVTMVTGYGASVLAPVYQGPPPPDKYAYLAPEQIIGGKSTASPATDVYALGALLYELLEEKAPYAGAPDIERAILTAEPPVIEEDGVRGRLGSIATTALSKRGSDRFESAAAMREAVLAALQDGYPATRDEIAAFVSALIPPEAPERIGRHELLEGALDPDAVSVLSRPPDALGGADSTPFEASRPGVVSAPAIDPAEFGTGADSGLPREERTLVDKRKLLEQLLPEAAEDRSEYVRDEETLVEHAAHPQGAFDSEEVLREARKRADTDLIPLVVPTQENDDAPTEADTSPRMPAPAPASVPSRWSGAVAALPGGLSSPAPGAHASPKPMAMPIAHAAGSGGSGFVPSPPPSMPSFAPQAGLRSDGPHPRAGFPQAPESASPPPPKVANNQSHAPLPRMNSTAQKLNSPAGVRVPKPREESVITAFDRKAGDSSRSVLIVILAGVALVLVGLFYFAQPPPEVALDTEANVRHALPKELVKAALTKPKGKDDATTEEPGEDPAGKIAAPAAKDPANPALDHAGEAAGDKEAALPTEGFGRIDLTTDPEVDVYDGTDLLGRTPLVAKLASGNRKLRFTDKKTGLNVYRTFRIRAGGDRRENISFGTSELIVEAPAGASILLNSRLIGTAPMDPMKIYEGSYLLKVTHDGKSWADSFDAPPGRKINYKVTLHD